MPRKSFTVDEANAIVPALTQAFREIDAHKARIREAARKIEVLELLWGSALRDPGHTDHADFMAHREAVDRALRAIQASVKDHVVARGLRLPMGGIEDGLVDFPTTYRGRWVYLCWQVGERELAYWHETDAGYRGRQAISRAQREEMGREDPSAIDDSGLDF
jgi:hypothetical protein